MIVIPMAGESRRFVEAGYSKPKYMLDLKGSPVFDHAVGSFSPYYDTVPFLFICRGPSSVRDFVAKRAEGLGIEQFTVALLEKVTSGQAETVLLGLDEAGVADDTPVSIFNIDTFRPGFRFPEDPAISEADGYLEVFRGEGENWSFVRPAGEATKALETAEKRPLSDLCCTGLYHFKQAEDFRYAYACPPAATSRAEEKERYVAPLYNTLIERGHDIRYQVVDLDSVIFCGVPAEYEALKAKY